MAKANSVNSLPAESVMHNDTYCGIRKINRKLSNWFVSILLYLGPNSCFADKPKGRNGEKSTAGSPAQLAATLDDRYQVARQNFPLKSSQEATHTHTHPHPSFPIHSSLNHRRILNAQQGLNVHRAHPDEATQVCFIMSK